MHSGETVDLTNCDREPIHLIGAVQPFGCLIAVSSPDWIITCASENVEQTFGTASADLIGRPLAHIFTPEAIHSIRGHLQSAIMGDTIARAFDLRLTAGGLCADVAVHAANDTIVIECEPSIDEPPLNSGAAVRGMIARLQQTSEQRTLYRVAAREMRALTGFDRVMVYRFEHDGSGEVVAESARSGLESYLGLHYPASDIPQQARILYQRNWLRIIPDVNATPSVIEPRVDRAGQPLDLSMSILRSVSPIHIEYLQNMGVAASMSVSILSRGKLWGLFACHHYAPHHVAFSRRTAAELFGQMFSLQVECREREEEAVYETRAQKLHNRLVTVMASEATKFESIVSHLDEIADLLNCDGVGVWVDESPTLKGLTPNETQFAELIAHLRSRDICEIHGAIEIAAEFPPGRAFADRAAGMLVVPLSRPARDYLIFFRKEVARSVNWAGDPTKPVTVGPLGARLTPRKSFELWKETVTGQSQPWLPVDFRIAEALRVSLLEVILRLTNLTEIERRRVLDRQEILIAELNHRVRNILSLIRGVVSQSKDSATTVESFTKVVGGRIHALARAHDQITADNGQPASFRSLVNAETGAYLGGKAARVVMLGPDVLLEPQAFTTVALVMHELVTNSAKYGALSDSRGRVEVVTAVDAFGALTIEWSEHGGPPVKPPTRRGFGSTIIESTIPHDLGGESELEFADTGVRGRFMIPPAFTRVPMQADDADLDQADALAPESGSPDGAETAAGRLPQDMLVVEDNLIIGLDAEDMLLSFGVKTVRLASSLREALKAIDEKPPAAALLDVSLGNDTSYEAAARLQALGIPFIFATGYREELAFPDPFADAPRLRKPYTAESLRAALEDVKDRIGGAGGARS